VQKKVIKKHPSYDLLFNHAMGNTAEAESLILSCHIAYCKTCKKELDKLEDIGGVYLENENEVDISKSLWSNVLDQVGELDLEPKKNNYTSNVLKTFLTDSDIKIPSFLIEYLENKTDTKNWSSAINNVRYYNIEFKNNNFKGKLLEIPNGKSMPKHGHESHEATLVLHGGYSDEKGVYNKGDLVFASRDEVHSPVSSDLEGCICLVVYAGSLKFKGLLGSILNLSKF
jgi:putative transcriptional regulator